MDHLTSPPNPRLSPRKGLQDVTNQNTTPSSPSKDKDNVKPRSPTKSPAKSPIKRPTKSPDKIVKVSKAEKDRKDVSRRLQIHLDQPWTSTPSSPAPEADDSTASLEHFPRSPDSPINLVAPDHVFRPKIIPESQLHFFKVPDLKWNDVKEVSGMALEVLPPGKHVPILQGPACGTSRTVNFRDLSFVKFRGNLFVFDQKCPHQGGNLCLGDIEDIGIEAPLISCPSHHWRFSVATGQCHHPTHGPTLQVYKYKLDRDQNIWIGFEAFAPHVFTCKDF